MKALNKEILDLRKQGSRNCSAKPDGLAAVRMNGNVCSRRKKKRWRPAGHMLAVLNSSSQEIRVSASYKYYLKTGLSGDEGSLMQDVPRLIRRQEGRDGYHVQKLTGHTVL